MGHGVGGVRSGACVFALRCCAPELTVTAEVISMLGGAVPDDAGGGAGGVGGAGGTGDAVPGAAIEVS